MFIFKMNASGEVLWTKLLGGMVLAEMGNDVVVDSSEHITGYTTGNFDGNTNLEALNS